MRPARVDAADHLVRAGPRVVAPARHRVGRRTPSRRPRRARPAGTSCSRRRAGRRRSRPGRRGTGSAAAWSGTVFFSVCVSSSAGFCFALGRAGSAVGVPAPASPSSNVDATMSSRAGEQRQPGGDGRADAQLRARSMRRWRRRPTTGAPWSAARVALRKGQGIGAPEPSGGCPRPEGRTPAGDQERSGQTGQGPSASWRSRGRTGGPRGGPGAGPR